MHAISGTTRLAGVIGTPLAHTLSPAMHNAAYAELGLDWVYVPLEVPDEAGLRRVAAAALSLPFVGFNITMPFKRAIFDVCDEVSAAAEMAGAVNTVHCHEGRLIGYNTDGRGLVEALEVEAGFTAADKDIVILGAGGAAGAALVALMLAKASRITVANRRSERAEELVDRMKAHAGGVVIEAFELDEAEQMVRDADLVLNATSLGMRTGDPAPVPSSWARSGQVWYDMVYGGRKTTAFVEAARAAGAIGVDGLGMLVAQGAIAIDIWNEAAPARASRQVMREAAEAALLDRLP